MTENTWLPMDELVNGATYAIHARNASFGIWDREKHAFRISRWKFGDNFLAWEYHWDTGPPCGTAKPEKLLDAKLEGDADMLNFLNSLEVDNG